MYSSNYKRLAEIVGGARVCLVGRHASKEETSGSLVVSINGHYEGADILFIGPNCPTERLEGMKPFGLVMPIEFGATLPTFTEWSFLCTYNQRHYLGVPTDRDHDWSNCLIRSMGTVPFTGVFAIELFSRLPCEEIYVTGFDFYASRSNYKLPAWVDGHEVAPQFRYLKNKLVADPRIRVSDDMMRDVFLSAEVKR